MNFDLSSCRKVKERCVSDQTWHESKRGHVWSISCKYLKCNPSSSNYAPNGQLFLAEIAVKKSCFIVAPKVIPLI